MTSTLFYLVRLFSVFFLAMLLAIAVGRERFHRTTAVILDISLYALLLCMGINTAAIEGIYQKLGGMGIDALVLAVSAMLGSFLLGLIYDLLFHRKSNPSVQVNEQHTQETKVNQLHEQAKQQHKQTSKSSSFLLPFIMVLCVAVGMVFQTVFPVVHSYLPSDLIDILLLVMMGMVGMQMVQSALKLKTLLTSVDLLVLPVLTITGSWIGALLVSLLLPYDSKQCIAMVSGFGWYSISGVLITQAGFPILGTISFLCNLMREMFSFFIVPLLGRLFPSYMSPSITVSGTSSMDFLLPILRRSYTLQIVPKAIIHGCIMAFLVPLLIPLWI